LLKLLKCLVMDRKERATCASGKDARHPGFNPA
jgi:hypothetical protein